MRNYKKYLAAALAATMTFGMSATAFASTTLATPSVAATPSDVTSEEDAKGELGGTGSVAGIVDKDVFHIVVPAIEDENTYYDFLLDPQGLINQTQGVSLNGATYDNTAVRTLYFRNIPAATGEAADLAGSAYDYSNVSQGFKVTNKSTMPVDVTFTAALTEPTGAVTLAEKNDFTDANGDTTTDTSVYLGIIKDSDAAVTVADGGTSVPAALGAAPANAYKESWTEDGGFAYELDPTATGVTFSSTVFKLTGASNPDGDWVELKDKVISPKLQVTWSVVEHSTKPSIAVKTYQMERGKDIEITCNMGDAPDAATGIDSIAYSSSKTLATENYSFAAGKLTIKAAWIDSSLTAGVDRTLKITFNDTSKTEVTVKLLK